MVGGRNVEGIEGGKRRNRRGRRMEEEGGCEGRKRQRMELGSGVAEGDEEEAGEVVISTLFTY